ncbi:uncharacterized protein ACLA_026920 [Aspergillus clavatus NRRL 1]|uniref:Protein PNS1 n=1 Tax=Aspergillus clavatus (strain ATCC 1007 / CBS 513.65 / DSM 816 / NCTC 3887 / NRRL 1 / QM 1276 / 107) TaxID=344612 RepID=A1CQP9_ASPCL|nr:uncharacterized protein ACLA_026920 [Aspergillus clavatus NRRL 1]EAW07970.1 conserved hypothetical protein [Aspergillus clavatus NRRL 1]
MFSESPCSLDILDASRFLAQSQSRLTPSSNDRRNGIGHSNQQPGRPRFSTSRAFLQMTIDPYQQGISHMSNFPFGSRTSALPAPLFFSANDELREDDDEAEREREIADYYALQRSRRHLSSSRLKDSLGSEEYDDSSASFEQRSPQDDRYIERRGIRSSWRASDKSTKGDRDVSVESGERIAADSERSDATRRSHSPQGNLVDVRLDDTLISGHTVKRNGTSERGDDEPPSVQLFREQPGAVGNNHDLDPFPIPTVADKLSLLDDPRILSPGASSLPPISTQGLGSPFHDALWGQLFLLSLACLLATSFLVYLHTSAPTGDKSKWGDTIYFTVHGSFHLLGLYTMISIFVSLLWLVLLRFYLRPMVYVIIFAVPLILYSFSFYPFISSFRGHWSGTSIQDKALRIGSLVPFIVASVWIYNVIQSRHSVGKAISILEFACRILAANLELLAVGLGVLSCIVCWTWIWMLMFARVFLGGHVSNSNAFAIDMSSWWLGVYFVIIYIWSLGVFAGIQKSVTAATVSQWYFHRRASPSPTSRQVVQAAFVHSVTTLFGTICFSKFIALSTRLPLLLLPSRVSRILNIFVYSFIPSSIAILADPLALTYAAIHSQPLASSARDLTRMSSISCPINASSFHPRYFSWSRVGSAPLLSYRLSKLILHAARSMMSLALGFGGWVSTARSFDFPGLSNATRGSMYAYVVGLIAGLIGWSILGAAEGVLADIVDASVLCWSSEMGLHDGEARYCREAGWLFGDDLANDVSRRPHLRQAEP